MQRKHASASQAAVGQGITFQLLCHDGAVINENTVHILLVTAAPTFVSDHSIDLDIAPVEELEASALLAP